MLSQLIERCRDEIVNMDGGKQPMIENVNCLVNVIAASSALAAVFISLSILGRPKARRHRLSFS